MEKISYLNVVEFREGWNDMGNWEAVWKEGKDEKNCFIKGSVSFKDCQNSLLISEDPNRELAALGLKDLVVVFTSDAVLVTNKDSCNEVGEIVLDLNKKEKTKEKHL